MKLFYFALPIIVMSCGLKANNVSTAQSESTPTKNETKKYPSGYELTYFVDEEGEGPKDGDVFYIHIINEIGDTTIFSSYKMVGEPVPVQIMPARQKGDFQEIFKDLSKGDSVLATIVVDSFMKGNIPPFAKSGDLVSLHIRIVDHKTQEELTKEKEEYLEKQKSIDDQNIQKYLSDNGIKAEKASSGYYYTIEKMGTGPVAKQGQTVSVNYTGRSFNGEVFDSNVDPKFNHVEPITFAVGTGSMIKGWDLAFQDLKQGTKATIYIPSYMAYGKNPRQGGPIKPDESLIFEVELLSVK